MSEEARLNVPCSEPARRAMRLGPFASSRDALKFGAWAAVGTAGSVVAGPLVAITFALVGFGLAVARVGGRPIDAQLETYLRWRRRRRATQPTGRPLAVGGGPAVAAVRAEGIPVAFLPVTAARELFGAYRELLRGMSCRSEIIVGLEALPAASLRDRPKLGEVDLEAEAARGYSEMMRLLLARRHRRRVVWVLRAAAADGESAATVSREAESLVDRLGAFGVRAERMGRGELARLLSGRSREGAGA